MSEKRIRRTAMPTADDWSGAEYAQQPIIVDMVAAKLMPMRRKRKSNIVIKHCHLKKNKSCEEKKLGRKEKKSKSAICVLKLDT